MHEQEGAAMSKALTIQPSLSGGKRHNIPIGKLNFDPGNPRFGERRGQRLLQQDILNRIVEEYGVDELLSSIAINGFFEAEPLAVIKKSDGRYTVVEGNRRLAACLILADDPRAKSQRKRHETFLKLMVAHNRRAPIEIPCIEFSEKEDSASLLSFLGVRHIVASQPWDSYAKAAWVARVIGDGALTLDDISQMIGDEFRTIRRMLEGYNVVRQLIAAGEFTPSNSYRKGKGSNTEYPFSWVYTLLGSQSARKFFGLGDRPEHQSPIPRNRVQDAGFVIRAMFGDRERGVNPVIDDSREISDLASTLADRGEYAELRRGTPVKIIKLRHRPAGERLYEDLKAVELTLVELNSFLTTASISAEEALEHIPQLDSIQKVLSELGERLIRATVSSDLGSKKKARSS